MAGKTVATFSKRLRGVHTKVSRVADPDLTLTPAEAKKVTHALKQVREGRTKPLAQIKRELDL